MPCYHLRGVFRNGGVVQTPCGQCRGCRLESSRQWAVRCMHESSLYDANAFVTLTVDDDHLYRKYSVPDVDRGGLRCTGSLDYEAIPLFMKRLRKAIEPAKVRYYAAGEYGDSFGRPHYHACLFGFDFRDKEFLATRGEFPVFRSSMLERLWTAGVSEVGSMTFESAAYVARYIMKKFTGQTAGKFYERLDFASGEIVHIEPERAWMSRNPGLGNGWFHKYKDEVYPEDHVVVRGVEARPPRYYDELLKEGCPEDHELIRQRRRKRANSRGIDNRYVMHPPTRVVRDYQEERLLVREEVAFGHPLIKEG